MKRLRAFLWWAGTLAGIILGSAVLNDWPPMMRIDSFFRLHQTIFLHVMIPLIILGFMMFMGGVIWMVISKGNPMTHQEVEQLSAQAAFPTSSYARVRLRGRTVGRQAEMRTSFHAIKEAVRTGAWIRDPQWRMFFVIASGAGLLFVAGFGVGVVAGPPVIKVMMSGALAYALLRMTIAFWKV